MFVKNDIFWHLLYLSLNCLCKNFKFTFLLLPSAHLMCKKYYNIGNMNNVGVLCTCAELSFLLCVLVISLCLNCHLTQAFVTSNAIKECMAKYGLLIDTLRSLDLLNFIFDLN